VLNLTRAQLPEMGESKLFNPVAKGHMSRALSKADLDKPISSIPPKANSESPRDVRPKNVLADGPAPV
jgi:hypothetical protein